MRFKIILALGALSISSSAFASMNADVFYNKAVALEKKGMLAAFSKDLKPLMNEMKSAGKALKADNAAAKAKGKPLVCPPKKAGMNSKQLIAGFASLGKAKRKTMNVKQAFKAIMIKKYPCR